MKNIGPELGVFDRVLATLGCVLAVYSIGMSLTNPPLAYTFSIGIIVLSFIGYAISTIVEGKKIANYDSYFWAIAAMATTGFVNPLNDILPGGGFPFALLAAGILCWLLLVGNLFAWRDQTLLFLTLPCIAIFGLVGTFDTFVPATALFFIFMLTIALLYARVHQRSMIERARHAGIEEPHLLKRGAWKWMAGPEWALASALVIILFSFMGAPVLQFSLKNVAGKVTVTPLQTPQNTTNTGQAQDTSDIRVGTGAIFLTNQEVMMVKLDQPRYLRLNSFSTYTGKGWKQTAVTMPSDTPLTSQPISVVSPPRGPNGGLLIWPGLAAPPQEPIVNGEVLEFTIKDSNNTFQTVISPGPLVEVRGNPQNYTRLAQGLVTMDKRLEFDEFLIAYALVPNQSPVTKDAVLPPALEPIEDLFLSESNIPARVRDLTYRVTKNAKTDYEKAIAIQNAIESRVTYNLGAERTPAESDPVDYFLFESNEGYCDLFASSMTLMARAAGLPARYTIGYIVNDDETDEDGFYSIKARDYHAWAEIYFEGIGWIPFDPTEGAPSADGAERGAVGAGVPWYKSTLFISTIGGVIVLALLAPVVVMFSRRSRTETAKAERAAGEIVKLHTTYFRVIEKYIKSPKRFSQTTREFVQASEPRLGGAYELAHGMVGDFESAMFAGVHLEKDAISNLGQRVAELKATLGRMKREKS